MGDLPVLHTNRLQLRILDALAAPAVLDYYARNREFHQPWFALRSDQVFTLKQQQINLASEHADYKAGRALPFWLSLQSEPERIIGRFAFTQIVRGCFDSCFAAYHLDQDCQSSGLAQEAGQALIPVVFNDFGLHRIEANIMPANLRSIALAKRLGFKLEGMSEKYLQINGKWENHLHFVRLAEETPAEPETIVQECGYLQIRPLRPGDFQAVLDYYERNQAHLLAWNPMPEAGLTGSSGWQRLIAASQSGMADGSRLDFGLFLKDRPERLVGTVECRSIMPLPYSCCEIGFSIDHLLAGRGLMPGILSVVISDVLSRFGLQRITAKCVANHDRSIRLLSLLGFRQEGLLRNAIFLNDCWQDLSLLALQRDEFLPFCN